jgi:8-oxo-dGTP pyrophosphatase MutT (NUDIX family)
MHLLKVLVSLFSIMSPSPSPSNDSKNDNNAPNEQLPRIDGVTEVASTKWLSLQTIDYTDQEGRARKWDVATRTTKQGTGADAVVIIPLLMKYGADRSTNNLHIMDTLIVEQFRPPMGQLTAEFPAGLIDKNESPETAALRELLEETGYVGESCKIIPQVSRQACMSPGVTDESVHIVVVHVDLDNPYNHGTPKQELDEGEHVTVKRVGLRDGLREVLEKGRGMPIEGLYLFALGLDLGLELGGSTASTPPK